MASELQKQVAALQRQRLPPDSLASGKASLFLTKKEAGNVDTSAVFEAALSGLKALAQYDDRFTWCFDSLLHPSSVDFQRELKTKEENKAVDLEIGRLLELLSLWPSEPNAHLVLEYLLRRYRIHEYNVDKLIRSMLVVHDSKIFAKVVQLCKLEGTIWTFLSGVKETGAPLPRSTLIKRSLKHPEVLDAICSATLSALQLVGIRQTPVNVVTKVTAPVQEGAQKHVSFFTAVVLEVASKHSFDEDKLRIIYLYLVEGLKTPLSEIWNVEQLDVLEDWKNSCFMIITQICQSTVLGDAFVRAISNAFGEALFLTKSANDERGHRLTESAFCVLIVLAQQGQIEITPKLLASLFIKVGKLLRDVKEEDGDSEWMCSAMTSLAESQVRVQELAERIIDKALQCLTGAAKLEDVKPKEVLVLLTGKTLASEVNSLIQLQTASSAFLEQLLISIFTHIQSSEEVDIQNDYLMEVVRCISHWYPQAFDQATQLSFKDKSNETNIERLSQFLAETFSHGGHHMLNFSGDSLFVALNSPVQALRIQGLTKLNSLASNDFNDVATPDLVGLAQSTLKSLFDFEVEVAQHLYTPNVLKFLCQYLPTIEVNEAIQQSWSWWVQFALTNDAKTGENILRLILVALSSNKVIAKLDLSWLRGVLMTVFCGDLIGHDNASFSWQNLTDSVQSLLTVFGEVDSVFSGLSSSHTVVEKKGKKASKKDPVVQGAISLDDFIASVASKLNDLDGYDSWIQSAINRLHLSTQSFIHDKTTFLSVCRFLLLVANKMDDKSKAENIIQKLTPKIIDVSKQDVENADVALISFYLEIVSKLHEGAANTVPDLMSFYEIATEAPTPARSRSIQLLVTLILSRHPKLLELIDTCLLSLFPHDARAALFQLIFCNGELANLPSDDATFVQQVGMQAWIVLVRCIFSQKTGKDAANNDVVLNSLVIVLWTANSVDSTLRKLSTILVKELIEHLPSNSQLTFALPKAGVPSVLGDKFSWPINDVCRPVLEAIEKDASIILLERDAVITSISTLLQEPKHASIIKFFFFIVHVLGARILNLTQLLLDIMKSFNTTSYWTVIQQVVDQISKLSDANESVIRLLLSFLTSAFFNTKEQSAVFEYLVHTIESSSEENAPNLIKTNFLSIVKRDIGPKLEGSIADSMFEKVFSVYLRDSIHQPALLDVLLSLNIEASIPLTILQEEANSFSDVKATSVDDSAKMEVDDEASNSFGAAIAMKRLTMVVEVVVPVILRSKDVQLSEFTLLVDILLKLLREAKGPVFKVVITHDYCKNILIEFVNKSFKSIEERGLLTEWVQSVTGFSETVVVADKKKRGGRKAKAEKEEHTIIYTIDRVVSDVQMVMSCMGELRQAETQHHAFGIIKVLLKVCPDAVSAAIDALGKLLVSAQLGHYVSKERFLSGVLEVLLPELSSHSTNEADVVSRAGLQLIMQNLCFELPAMAKGHRRNLLRTVLKVLHDKPDCVFLVVHVLLAHTLASYESEYAARVQSSSQVENICLSRAGQRRAQRLLHASLPEEFFQLAVSLLMSIPVASTVEVLSNLLATSLETIQLVVNDPSAGSHHSANRPGAVDVKTSLSYIQGINQKSITAINTSNAMDYAATMAVLQIEFVWEILENRDFHLNLAKQLGSKHDIVSFLEVADGLLQLINYCEYQKALPRSEVIKAIGKNQITLRLEENVYGISHSALMSILTSCSADALQSLQLLFDAPTFISICQELLSHEILGIRQKALLVLRQRLQRLLKLEKPNVAEMDLYIDLSSHVRDIIRKHAQQLLSQSSSSGSSSNAANNQTALVQSAIMCLDILVQLLGASGSWAQELNSILDEFVEMSEKLYAYIESIESAVVSGKAVEVKKLLGSVFLCIATCCKMLGAGCLSKFSRAMGHTLIVLDKEVTKVVSSSVAQTEGGIYRSELLFLQSIISTCTVLVVALPTFVHPYLNKVLSSFCRFSAFYHCSTAVHNKEQVSSMEAIDHCLLAVGGKIPSRLLLPVLLSIVDVAFSSGHETSLKFVQLIRSVAEKADRVTIISQLPKWLSLSLALLDYRRSYGDRSPVGDNVEHEIHNAITELCLKFTETELKAFITQINDWKNKSDEREGLSWTKEARCVTFYGLVHQLLDKLKFLFHPTFALFWPEVPEILKYVIKSAKKIILSQHGDLEGRVEVVASSAKKRKKQGASDIDISESQRQSLDELINLSTLIVTCVHGLCADSDVPFMNEDRYESVASPMLDFLSLRQVFSSDLNFLEFMTSVVSPALTAITAATSNELLWKPVNHQILMLTRNGSVAVRRAAVALLKDLFVGVGDDYSALLPECLPFLSELLEDDHNDVIADTRRTIAAIEELTGEKLDTYFNS